MVNLFASDDFVSCIVQTEAFDWLIIFFQVGHFDLAPAGLTPAKTKAFDKLLFDILFPLLICNMLSLIFSITLFNLDLVFFMGVLNMFCLNKNPDLLFLCAYTSI